MPGQQERQRLFAMPRITISYRRDDSLDITGRIFDRLAGHFGREAVFRDIDSIPLGADFRRHIDRVLDQSDIILAIVGPRWIGPDHEHLRLANPADPVRLEIEAALRKDKPLIPVLVSRAVMPQPDVLPDSLHGFVYRNAVQVDSGQDFDVHFSRLIRAIEQLQPMDEERTADEAVRSAPAIEPTPKAERPADPAESPIDRPVVRASGGHTVHWVMGLGLVVIVGIIGASGRWVLVEQPREAVYAAKARQEDADRHLDDRLRRVRADRNFARDELDNFKCRDSSGATVVKETGRATDTGDPKVPTCAQVKEALGQRVNELSVTESRLAFAKVRVEEALKNGIAALDRKDYAEAMRWYPLIRRTLRAPEPSLPA